MAEKLTYPEETFCTDCPDYGEPNGCNRAIGTCKGYGVFMDIYDEWIALKDANEQRNEECPWCKAEYTIIDDDFGQPIHPNMITHCFRCGRKLNGEE